MIVKRVLIMASGPSGAVNYSERALQEAQDTLREKGVLESWSDIHGVVHQNVRVSNVVCTDNGLEADIELPDALPGSKKIRALVVPKRAGQEMFTDGELVDLARRFRAKGHVTFAGSVVVPVSDVKVTDDGIEADVDEIFVTDGTIKHPLSPLPADKVPDPAVGDRRETAPRTIATRACRNCVFWQRLPPRGPDIGWCHHTSAMAGTDFDRQGAWWCEHFSVSDPDEIRRRFTMADDLLRRLTAAMAWSRDWWAPGCEAGCADIATEIIATTKRLRDEAKADRAVVDTAVRFVEAEAVSGNPLSVERVRARKELVHAVVARDKRP